MTGVVIMGKPRGKGRTGSGFAGLGKRLLENFQD